MYPRQGYMHSPSLGKPQSYFSRVLLPDERPKNTHTPRTSKRSSYCGDALSSPRNSKRHISRSKWNFCCSPDHNAGSSRMPTLLDFQPDPGYSSMAFKRHLRRGASALSHGPKVRTHLTEPVAQSSETVERALRILDSKKRAPLHLDTNFSPNSDLSSRNNSMNQDSKRRCLLPSSYSLDVASVGSAKENDAFQYTSLDQLRQRQLYQETTNANHVTNKDTYCSVTPLPVQRILDAESSSFQPRNKTPSTEVRSPSMKTPKSASSVRRLIPYMSPAELDALFLNKINKYRKDSADKDDLLDVDGSDSDEEFVGVSHHLADHSGCDGPYTLKSEEIIKRSEACTAPSSHVSTSTTSPDTETVLEPDRIPCVGSVARFVANLEARGRKLSPTAGSMSISRTGSLMSTPYHCNLPFRSPSEISTRVDRIRKLLLSKSDQVSKLQDNSTIVSDQVKSPNFYVSTCFSSPLAFGLPKSVDSLAATTTTTAAATLSSISTVAPNSAQPVSVFTTKATSPIVSSATTTGLAAVSSGCITTVSDGVPLSTISSTPAFGLSTGTTPSTVGLLSFGISTGASTNATGNIPTISNSPVIPEKTVNTAFKFSFPNPASSNATTPTIPDSVASTSKTGLQAFSFPTTISTASAAVTASQASLQTVASTTNATSTTQLTATPSTLSHSATSSNETNLSFGVSSVSSTAGKISTLFGTSGTSTVTSTVANPSVQTSSSSGLFSFTTASPLTVVTSSTAPNTSASLVSTSLFSAPTLGTSNFSATKTPASTATIFGSGFSTVSSPFTFNKPAASVTATSSALSFGVSNVGSSVTTPATSSTSVTTTTAPASLPFSFKSTSASVTATSTEILPSGAPAPPSFTFSKSSLAFGGGSTTMASTTTTTITTTSSSVTQPTFTGFNFGSSQSSRSTTLNLFSPAVTNSTAITTNSSNSNNNTSTNSSSNLFTLGFKSTSFSNAATAATATPPASLNFFNQSQSTSATIFGGSTTVVTTNPSPFSFGAPGSSTQLTSSATAPGQLFQSFMNPAKTTSTTSSSFSLPAVTTTVFQFGRQSVATATTSSTIGVSNGFQGFGTAPVGAAPATTTTSTPFFFGAAPAFTKTGFNFSSPSINASLTGSPAPTFGSSTGFNFGQPVNFGGPSTGSPNPFAFGTTPPAAPGTVGAVAVARRRPASARRTRRP